MKKQSITLHSIRRFGLMLGLATLAFSVVYNLHAQNGPPPPSPFSIMTYQGKLDDFGGGPADGRFDFRISAVTPPFPCFGTDCGWFTNCPDCSTVLLGTSTVTVDHGLFTLAINMPTGMVHTVNGTFLKFEVRPSGSGEFTTLLPMQPITAVPLATVAQSVVGPISASSLTGTMPTGMLTGIFSSPLTLSNPNNVFAGDGSQLANVNATTIGGLAPCDLPCLQNFWKLTGNAVTTPDNFLGTAAGNNQWLEMRVNGKRALRLLPDDISPNILGGSPANFIGLGSRGSVIAGGGAVSDPAFDDMAPNRILGANLYEVIGGGYGNSSSGGRNVIGGGQHNTMRDANGSVIGGGNYNLITHPVDGGAIVGGSHNTVTGSTDTNLPSGDLAFIGAGHDNTATNFAAVIGGGGTNVAGGKYSVVAGGYGNQVVGSHGAVGGGSYNTASGINSTVPGGGDNTASGYSSLAAGSRARAIHDGTFVWSDPQNTDFASTAPNQFAIRAENGVLIQGSKTALDLRGNGAIRVAGAGVGTVGPVFIHRATAASITGHITTIDHPLANGDPNAILMVTHNWSADTASTRYETIPVGVWYNGSKWTIFHEDTSVAMPAGRAFNVMIVKP